MTIQRTRWQPDTCNCIIDYEWDDTVAQGQRVHAAAIIIRQCPAHAHHSDKHQMYDDLLSENTSKNRAIGQILETHPELNGKEGAVKWRFNQDRSIVIELPEEIKSSKQVLNDLVKDKFPKNVSFE